MKKGEISMLKNVYTIFCFVTLLQVAMATSCVSAQDLRGTAAGSLVSISVSELEGRVESAIRAGDFESLYSLFSIRYKSVMPFRVFSKTIQSQNLDVRGFDILRSVVLGKGGYFVCRMDVINEGKTESVFDVVFFSDVEGVWYLENFPFSKVTTLNFPVVPDFLKKGLSGVEGGD